MMILQHKAIPYLPAALCTGILLLFLALGGKAQPVANEGAEKMYVIHEDSALTELRERYIHFNQQKDFTDGYRIQVTYTNVRDEVYQSKAAMYKQFPELASYVEYEQPYYKLRIGDFKTRLEATYYLRQVIPIYSGAFIVHDKIKKR